MTEFNENSNKPESFIKLFNTSKSNSLFLIFILLFSLFATTALVTWIYFDNKAYKRDTLLQELSVLKDTIAEKKELRSSMNTSLSEMRLLRLSIKEKCGDNFSLKDEIDSKYEVYRQNYFLIKFIYSAKYVFGQDISGLLKSIIKLSDSNSNICIDGHYDLELRKLQWKANVLIDDSLIRDNFRIKEIFQELS